MDDSDHPRYMFKDPQEERASRDRSRDPVDLADQCLAELTGEVPPSRDVAKLRANKMNRAASDPSMRDNSRGFKTHVPGIFDKIQARLDSSVKLVDDEVVEGSNCKSNTPAPPRDEVPPLRETIKPKPPVSNRRRVSAPAMQGNPRGFKTHVPGIFDKIQARLDSSVKLVDEETEEVSYCKPSKITTARFAEPRHAEKPEVVRGSKPASLSRSSSVLSSDDPIEIADQCLAEFQGSIPNIPSPEAITPARDVFAASSVSPSRDVAKLRATTMNRAASAPSMRGNSRGFKTHVPGIFDKIQARLDPSVKLVDDEIDNDKTDTPSSDIVTPPNDVVTPPSDVVTPPSKVITPPSRDDIDKRLNELEPDGFQYHVPDVFNKIQQKLYLNPEVKEGSEEIDSTNNTKSAQLLKI